MQLVRDRCLQLSITAVISANPGKVLYCVVRYLVSMAVRIWRPLTISTVHSQYLVDCFVSVLCLVPAARKVVIYLLEYLRILRSASTVSLLMTKGAPSSAHCGPLAKRYTPRQRQSIRSESMAKTRCPFMGAVVVVCQTLRLVTAGRRFRSVASRFSWRRPVDER